MTRIPATLLTIAAVLLAGCGDDEVREAPEMPRVRHHARPGGGRLPRRAAGLRRLRGPGLGLAARRLPRGRLRGLGQRDGGRARARSA